MFHWLQHASRSLSRMVEDAIHDEDASANQKKEILAPLQAHLGLLKTKPKPLFHVLPNELKLYIFSFLPPEELIRTVCLVCREWRKLGNDEESWKERFYADADAWNIVGYHPAYPKSIQHMPNELPFIKSWHSHSIAELNPHMHTKQGKELTMSWKSWYIQQYLHNSKLHHSPEHALRKIMSQGSSFRPSKRNGSGPAVMMFQTQTRNIRSQKRDIFRIPIFGQAMEGSASGLLYKLMWSQESPLLVTGLYPGVDGIGSGVGFKINSTSLNLAAIYGDCASDISEWKEFFEAADGFIYVVDYCITDSQILHAQKELKTVLQTNDGVPLVVFSCVGFSDEQPHEDQLQDDQLAPIPSDLPVIRSPSQIAAGLGLLNLSSRRWCVRSAQSLSDICKGLEWLSMEMISH